MIKSALADGPTQLKNGIQKVTIRKSPRRIVKQQPPQPAGDAIDTKEQEDPAEIGELDLKESSSQFRLTALYNKRKVLRERSHC